MCRSVEKVQFARKQKKVIVLKKFFLKSFGFIAKGFFFDFNLHTIL